MLRKKFFTVQKENKDKKNFVALIESLSVCFLVAVQIFLDRLYPSRQESRQRLTLS